MSNRSHEFGMDVAIARKLNSKYEPKLESEILDWIEKLNGNKLTPGRENVFHCLKSGEILCQLINIIYSGSSNLRPEAQQVRMPIKFSTTKAPFKQMENIEIFLRFSEIYGVPRTCLFQTVDLFECRNIAQVLNTILQLGTECQRYGFQGPVCGPKPSNENRRTFTEEQMRSGETVIGLQSGSNQFASQKGMSIGATRHVADIRCDDINQKSHGILSLQMGTNQYASQKGMSIGATRHIADIRCDDICQSGNAVVSLQMGSNKGASQKGMVFGGVRHINDVNTGVEMNREGQGVISLQYGTNQFASQKGMKMGNQRHITDVRCDEPNREASSSINLQMGVPQNMVASQSGMSFGAQRHITDSH